MRRVRRVILWVISSVFLLLLLAGGLLLLPSVQTALSERIAALLFENIPQNVEIGRVDISPFGKIIIDDIYISDHHGDTLINVPSLSARISMIDLFFSRIHVRRLQLDLPKVNMVKYQGEEKNSMALFIENFKRDTPIEVPVISSAQVRLNGGRFSYTDLNLPEKAPLEIRAINFVAQKISVRPGSYAGRVRSLSAEVPGRLSLLQFSFSLLWDQKHMTLDDLSALTSRSFLNGHFDVAFPVFEGDSADTLRLTDKFKNSDVHAQIGSSYIHPNEFAFLIPALRSLEDVSFSLSAMGRLQDMKIERFNLSYGSDTHVSFIGDIALNDSLRPQSYRLLLSDLTTDWVAVKLLMERFKVAMPSDKVQGYAASLGKVSMSGLSDYGNGKIDADFQILTDQGSLSANVTASALDMPKKAEYEVKLSLNGLNIGKILSVAKLGKVTAYFDLKGQGFRKQYLKAKLDARFKSLWANGYEYNDVNLHSKMSADSLDVRLTSGDRNLRFDLKGGFSASVDGEKKLSADLFLDNSNLYAIRLAKDTVSSLSAHITTALRWKMPDDMTGFVRIDQANYQNSSSLNFLDLIDISLEQDGQDGRMLTLNSNDMIDGYLKGDFTLTEIPAALYNAFMEGTGFSGQKKVREGQDYRFDFAIYDDFFQVLSPDIRTTGRTFLKGEVTTTEPSVILDFGSDRAYLGNTRLDTVRLHLVNSAWQTGADLTVSHYLNRFFSVQDFKLHGARQGDTLRVRTDLAQFEHPEVHGTLNLYQTKDERGQFVIGIVPSQIYTRQNTWYLNRNDRENRFIYDPADKSWEVEQVGLTSDHGGFYLAGESQPDEGYKLDLLFQSVRLTEMLAAAQNKVQIGGELNGRVYLEKLDRDHHVVPGVSLVGSGISVNGDMVGDLNLNLDLGEQGDVNADIFVKKGGKKTFSLAGTVFSASTDPIADLQLKLDGFGVSPFQGLIPLIFSQMSGSLSGQAAIEGELSDLQINGEMTLNDVGLKVAYTNVLYQVKPGTVVDIRDSYFIFNDISLTDMYGNMAAMGGRIYHNKFKDWALDLDFTVNKTLVLDTERTMNPVFYGRAFASGGMKLSGPTSGLIFDIHARTEKGTVFDLPMDDAQQVKSTPFIEFVPPIPDEEDLEQKMLTSRQSKEEAQQNMTLKLTLEATNDAIIQVILNRTVGDILKGTGQGRMVINFNSRSELFTMDGSYHINKGDYLFTLKNIINKRFTIEQGGTISFEGNPTNPLIDLYAIYQTQTNPGTYLQSSNGDKREEVTLRIHLTNTLEAPQFTYDITMPKAPENMKSELAYKLSEGDQLDQQFMSLLAFNTFTNTGNTTNTNNLVATGVVGATTEMLSNQLSNMVSDLVEGFAINVNLASANQNLVGDNQRTDFEVGLSHKLFNDRVTVNGMVGVPVGTTQSNFVGDVEIEVDITRDGRLKGVVFNRRQQWDYISNQLGYEQGLGISYRQEFNTFQELMYQLFGRKMTPEERKRLREERRQRRAVYQSEGQPDRPKEDADTLEYTPEQDIPTNPL